MGHCTYLLPFGTASQQANERGGHAEPFGDNGCVVDELVGAILEEKQAGDEGRNVEQEYVGVRHGG